VVESGRDSRTPIPYPLDDTAVSRLVHPALVECHTNETILHPESWCKALRRSTWADIPPTHHGSRAS
jgi:hypothetical protein